ncbi:MAG: hypothetical protein KBD90_05740 [Alphaproteobacteria bacterium]|nr:hypothetical protein [Alphaproteobacteria bacterium]
MKNFKLLSTSLIVALSFAASQASYGMKEENQNSDKSTISRNKIEDDNFENIQVHYIKHPWEENVYQEDVMEDQLKKELKKSRLCKQYGIAGEHEKKSFERYYNLQLNHTDPETKKTTELFIWKLFDPVDGEVNISQFPDVAQHISINVGFREKKREENTGKLEFWFTPWVLVEKNIKATTSYFHRSKPFRDSQDPIGLFVACGEWELDEFIAVKGDFQRGGTGEGYDLWKLVDKRGLLWNDKLCPRWKWSYDSIRKHSKYAKRFSISFVN